MKIMKNKFRLCMELGEKGSILVFDLKEKK